MRCLVPAALRRTIAAVSLLVASVAVGAEPERGEYLVRAGGCVACHTDKENDGAFLAGGRALHTPFGTFHAPNITSDPEHGIGAWGLADFTRAMRSGVAPDGTHYYPVFPYTSYTGITDADLAAMLDYLKRTPAVDRPNRGHDIPWYMRWRFVNRLWKLLFFDQGPFESDSTRADSWNRGAYLTTALSHCDECHTPRNRFGALDMSRRFEGAALADDETAPNITSDREHGIGNWDVGDLAEFLRTGMLYDGDFTGGPMWEVVDDGLSHLKREDLEAIAEYVLSVPPPGSGGG